MLLCPECQRFGAFELNDYICVGCRCALDGQQGITSDARLMRIAQAHLERIGESDGYASDELREVLALSQRYAHFYASTKHLR